MSIQAIINTAQTMEFDLRKTIAQSISSSKRIKYSERTTTQPFVLTIDPLARFRFSEARGVLEAIVNADRDTETQIYLGSGSLSYINRYQGSLTSGNLAALTITNFTGTSISIQFLDLLPVGSTYFKAGDWIQPANSRYPYIITQDLVKVGLTAIHTATVHRPFISSEGVNVVGQTILCGTATNMRVIVSQIPTYRLTQKDWCEFTGQFVLIEKIL